MHSSLKDLNMTLRNGGANFTDPVRHEEPWNTLMVLYLGALLIVSMLLNGVVCLVFYKKPHLLNISNSFVLNLSCCELGFSLLVLPFTMASIVSDEVLQNKYICIFQGVLFTLLLVAIQFSLLIIAIDRNYAIIHSLQYPNVFTQRLCNTLITTTWLIGTVLGLSPVMGLGSYKYHASHHSCFLDWYSDLSYVIFFIAFSFGVPILIQSWCYLRIFKAAISHTRRGNKVYPWMTRASSTSVIEVSTTELSSMCIRSENIVQGHTQISRMRFSSTQCKAVRTLVLIAMAYVISWLPFLITIGLALNSKENSLVLDSLSICFVFLTCLFNPMIYAFMNRVIRCEISKYVCGMIGKISGVTTTFNDSDEFYSNTMSTFSSGRQITGSVFSQGFRMRSRSTGGIVKTNEMDPIEEEPEVVFETKSENDIQILDMDPANVDIHEEAKSSSERKQGETVRETMNGTTPRADFSPLRSNHTTYTKSRLSIIEDMFSPFRKPVRAQSESLLVKNTKHCKADGGSFLNFESSRSKIHNRRRHSHQSRMLSDTRGRMSLTKVLEPLEFQLMFRRLNKVYNRTSSPLSLQNYVSECSQSVTDELEQSTSRSASRISRKSSAPSQRWSNAERLSIGHCNPVIDRNCFSA
ncbi:hypothetical protein CHS0354_035843 [Potamilus streckersoni]|uniref:G-protein coupled receptors family 1 profile domain-containing protein n=1 Tax=Potamilus streckersoni TaxID=2493646 RepID=A0AAE0SWP9_9BIVA|nr:hypothetical protein CHS0354_035843 [Potamilus streckersoni]